MNPLLSMLAQSVPVVRLFEVEPSGSMVPGWVGGWWIAGVAAGLAACLWVSMAAWRGRWRAPADERAFTLLSRSLGLRAPSRRVVERLARPLGAQPVALLVSEAAFEKALELAEGGERGRLSQSDRALAMLVRAKVFGG